MGGERAECGRQLEVMEMAGLQGIESPLFLLKLVCLLSRFGQGIFSDVTYFRIEFGGLCILIKKAIHWA